MILHLTWKHGIFLDFYKTCRGTYTLTFNHRRQAYRVEFVSLAPSGVALFNSK